MTSRRNNLIGSLEPKGRGRRRRSGRQRLSTGVNPTIERLEDRRVLSGFVYNGLYPITQWARDLPTDPNINMAATVSDSNDPSLYRVTLDGDGRFVARVQVPSFDTHLSLLDAQGNTLIQSEGSSPTNPDNQIDQHLSAGTYYLEVQSLQGSVVYGLSTTFTPAVPPYQAIGSSDAAVLYSVTTADLTGNHIQDLITPDYYNSKILIHFGTGDGTFRPDVAIPVGLAPAFVLAGDFTGNGIIDLAVADQQSNDITILLGNGDGTFQNAGALHTAGSPSSVVAGDFNHDGHVDLAVAESTNDTVEVFAGRGDGTFFLSTHIDHLPGADSLAAGDFSGDGKLDLAVACGTSGAVVLLKGQGNGTFVPESQPLMVGPGCESVIAADFNGDGHLDLAAVSPAAQAVSVFMNDGHGNFLHPTMLTAGKLPGAIVAADFSGSGHLDLAVANYGSNDVSVFRGAGDGTFQLTATLPTGGGPIAITAANFNGGTEPDIATADFIGQTVSVLLNNGDGTFLTPPQKPVLTSAESVVSADLTGDGILDLVIPEVGTNDIAVLLGRGDGTFRAPIRTPDLGGPFSVTVGDFNGDHIPDLAVVDLFTNTISIYDGHGDGTFQLAQTLARGAGVGRVQAADLTGNGILDLVVTNYDSNDISIFYGNGDGTFQPQVRVPVGYAPDDLLIADLNGDHRPDLIVDDAGSNDVEVLLNKGGRNFTAPMSFPAGPAPTSLAMADLLGNGRIDLVAADYGSTNVSILMGNGDGTFQPPVAVPVGVNPYIVKIGDFTGHGHLDLLTGSLFTNTFSLLAGLGGGKFAAPVPIQSDFTTFGMDVGDFNGDGHLDIVSINNQSDVVSVELARGDGTFQAPETVPLIGSSTPMVIANLAGDSVTYMVEANPDAGTITIRQGQGDGTFRVESTLTVGDSPSGLAVGDFNGDGRLDLAVTDSASGTVLVLLGNGDGTFQDPIRYKVGKSPQSIVAGDFLGNGKVDLAVADTDANTVTLLDGNGDGTFRLGASFAVGVEPVALVAADFVGNGRLDLVTANRTSGDLTFLWNEGGGQFRLTTWSGTHIAPSALYAGDIDGDGHPDLAVTDQAGNRILIFYGLGGGAFAPVESFAVGQDPIAISGADLDAVGDGSHDLVIANAVSNDLTVLRGLGGDSYKHVYTIPLQGAPTGLAVGVLTEDIHPDLAVGNGSTSGIDVYLGVGDGAFTSPESTVPLPGPPPLVAHDGGVLTIDENGQVIRRDPSPTNPKELGAAQNLSAGTETYTREMIPVVTVLGWTRVSLAFVQNLPMLVVTRPTTDASGADILLETDVPLPANGIYTRLASGALFADGREDLVVLNGGAAQILIFRQDANGQFTQYGNPISVGDGPTDLTVANLNHDACHQILVTNGTSGDLSIIPVYASGVIGPEARVRAGLEPSGVANLSDGLTRSSPDEPVGVVTGVFDVGGLTDAVVVDRGTDRISILKGTPGGGLADPNPALTYRTGLDPTQVLAADLNGDGRLDLVVLNQGSQDISVFLNDGKGGFVALPRIDAGDHPTGISAYEPAGDDVPELFVSNPNGDLLVLVGKGDGTFQPYQRAGDSVSLAVGDLYGNGQQNVVLSNAAADQLTAGNFTQNRNDGLKAPGPVVIADLNGDGVPDLVVTNRGGNDVLVFLGIRGTKTFAPARRFFTGTAPEGLTIANLDSGSDSLLDLVVTNSGSNDVTILLGVNGPDGWTMVPGPRLRVGDRPVSTTVADLDGNGLDDILCVNQDSNSVTLLRGLGNGFFDDQNAPTFATGQAPIQAFVGKFDANPGPGLVVLNSLSNDMTYYSAFVTDKYAPVTIPIAGTSPIAGAMVNAKSGYPQLYILNQGGVTVFDGTDQGLVQANSVALSSSEQAAALAVGDTEGGNVHLFIGLQGGGQVLSLSFASALAVVPTAGEGHVASPSASPTAESQGGTGSLSPLTGAIASFLVGTVQGAIGTQGQAAAGTTASASTSTGASISSAVVNGIVSQVAQPLFSPSLRSYASLLETLAQIGQSQIAEILPLSGNDMAAVAVLLVVSDSSDPAAAGPVANRTDLTAGLSTLIEPDQSASPIERFLLDIADPTLGISYESGGVAASRTGLGPEWVWREGVATSPLTSATFPSGVKIGESGRGGARQIAPPGSGASAGSPSAAASWELQPDGASDSHQEARSPFLSRLAAAASVVLLSTATYAWKRWGRRAARRDRGH